MRFAPDRICRPAAADWLVFRLQLRLLLQVAILVCSVLLWSAVVSPDRQACACTEVANGAALNEPTVVGDADLAVAEVSPPSQAANAGTELRENEPPAENLPEHADAAQANEAAVGADQAEATPPAALPAVAGHKPPPSGEDAAKPKPSPPHHDGGKIEQMLALINADRQAAGLQAVRLVDNLSAIARAHAQEMINLDYFDHNSPNTGSPGDRVRAAGISFSYVGENLAGYTDVVEAHQALMDSPGHRENILHPDVRQVGLAFVEGGTWDAMIVQLFLAPRE